MILQEIQDYIENHGRVSLAQMELKFGVDSTALRGMLSYLSRRGRIRSLPIPPRCHGCLVCARESLEFYERAEGTNCQSCKDVAASADLSSADSIIPPAKGSA